MESSVGVLSRGPQSGSSVRVLSRVLSRGPQLGSAVGVLSRGIRSKYKAKVPGQSVRSKYKAPRCGTFRLGLFESNQMPGSIRYQPKNIIQLSIDFIFVLMNSWLIADFHTDFDLTPQVFAKYMSKES